MESYQIMEHGKAISVVEVESQRSKVKVMACASVTDIEMAVSPSILKLEYQNKNWNTFQAINDTCILTVVVLCILRIVNKTERETILNTGFSKYFLFRFYSIDSSPKEMTPKYIYH